jgi:hypothetical protein
MQSTNQILNLPRLLLQKPFGEPSAAAQACSKKANIRPRHKKQKGAFA